MRVHKPPRPADFVKLWLWRHTIIWNFSSKQTDVRFVWKEKSFVVIMRIIFVLTALVGLLLLSITLNAERKGKIFRRLNKRLEGLFFSSTKKFFFRTFAAQFLLLKSNVYLIFSPNSILCGEFYVPFIFRILSNLSSLKSGTSHFF